MKNPTEVLSQEHKNILDAIDILVRECSAIEKGKEIDPDLFGEIISFIRNYADKLHHMKEEEILFKEFNKQEGLHCNPVEQMLHEHNLGREFVKNMEQGVKERRKDKIIENAMGYANLLKEHIFKEDNILYPMADQAFSSTLKTKIKKDFEKIDKDKKAERERYLAFVKKKK